MKLIAFTYAFNHKKSQEGLLALTLSGLKPTLVIAQPHKDLPIIRETLEVSPKNANYLHDWKALIRRLDIPFVMADHDSDVAHLAIRCSYVDTGVILGSRILKQPTIDMIPNGILNMHPGILPYNRGLSNLKRAILDDLPPVVSFHWIDKTIDQGILLDAIRVPIYPQDTMHSIFMRHQKIEIEGMINVLKNIKDFKDAMPMTKTKYPTPIGNDRDEEVLSKFEQWKRNFMT